MDEYLPIVVFALIAAGLASFLVVLPMILAKFSPSPSKLTRYECGFDPLSSPRARFDIRFYLVSILFVLFDLEIVFLFPWSIVLGQIGDEGFYSMMSFLGFLAVGFIYEWKRGALEWI